ncbi:MAG TPA: hypothetical protein VI864_06460 [Candidatus Bathyarchaeia archaeon]|nr:hypothetical protein [Candidatus Bathyarchaeia archaeon]
MKHKAKTCRSVAVCLIVSMLLTVWLVPACFAVDAAEASGTIDQTEHDLSSAFAMVAEAESAGANVSALLNKLEIAGDFLSRAYAAFGTGDYENANSLAVDCSHTLKGLANDAASLKLDAEKAQGDRLLFTAMWSGMGEVSLLVLGFLGWKFLKRRHFRRVLDMKPQVEGVQ